MENLENRWAGLCIKRVWLCADCGRLACLSDPALHLMTPAWPVFSLNHVVALSAPPHSLSLASVSAAGTRCWLLGVMSRFRVRDQHQTRVQVLQAGGVSRLGWARRVRVSAPAAGAGQQTQPRCLVLAAGGLWVSVCPQNHVWEGCTCANHSKLHAGPAGQQEVPGLGRGTAQAEDQPLTTSLHRKCSHNCLL